MLPLLCLLASFAPPQESDVPAVRWTLGKGIQAQAGALKVRLRPRFHFDLVDPRFRDLEEITGERFEESIGVRRARILGDFGFRDGTALDDWGLRLQIDFASSDLRWLDLAASYAGLPTFQAGAQSLVRFGQFREPFGLEAMTSVSHLPFIERSAASNAFTPGRSRGIQWSEQAEHSLFQLGGFREAAGDPFPDELGDQTYLTARALWQPGRSGERAPLELVQLGGSVSVRSSGDDSLRFSARPGSRFFARTVDTGAIQKSDAVVFGTEALLQAGPTTWIAEWFAAAVDADEPGFESGLLQGGHLGASWFLAGSGAARFNPRRGGLRSASVPDLVRPSTEAAGALEAVMRLTLADLDGGSVRGGRSVDLEAGINYYVQPGTRFMLHWLGVRLENAGASEYGHAVLARLQFQL